ncbi:hypothetical protein M758_10G131300 [Ceratodon purpureus]|nr:hypothetical protein M758_10G131300 [Ceratodon purpureus]
MSMMKRGSCRVGNGAQAHKRARHDAIPSGLDLERGRAISDYVKVVGLAACSIAISILMWRLRPGSPPEFHLLGHNHQQPRKPGIVFPLYQYYHQWGNRSHRERSGRGLRAENPLFDLRWVQRSLDT